MKTDVTIILIFMGSLLWLFFTIKTIQEPILNQQEIHWILSLLLNLLSYSVIILPGFLVLMYIKKIKYLEKEDNYGWLLKPLIEKCYFGEGRNDRFEEVLDHQSEAQQQPFQNKFYWKFLHLVICCLGLQASYLTWGVLQEKIMTRHYYDETNKTTGQFSDSQFLVFVNRVLALAVSGLYLTFTQQPGHRVPMYKYSYCSLSNILSSWCQYEALKFISFPTQVLAKASKIIPVMMMGYCVSGKKYDKYQYVSAVFISMGMILFLFGSSTTPSSESQMQSSTTFSGVLLLVGYMTCDAFTSNWQNKLFQSYQVTSIQAMFGINLFSTCLTLVSLLLEERLMVSLVFMFQYTHFALDCIVLSFCSAVGQLFIFHTISVFGKYFMVCMLHS